MLSCEIDPVNRQHVIASAGFVKRHKPTLLRKCGIDLAEPEPQGARTIRSALMIGLTSPARGATSARTASGSRSSSSRPTTSRLRLRLRGTAMSSSRDQDHLFADPPDVTHRWVRCGRVYGRARQAARSEIAPPKPPTWRLAFDEPRPMHGVGERYLLAAAGRNSSAEAVMRGMVPSAMRREKALSLKSNVTPLVS